MERRRKNGGDIWESDDFIDIRSHSTSPPPPPPPSRKRRGGDSRPSPRPPSSIRDHEDFRDYREASRGPESRRNSTASRQTRERRRERERERKPRRSHRGILGAALFFMVVVTALLCAFLLFRITQIDVTGDVVYRTEEVIKASGMKQGDNLLFFSAAEKERKLSEQLPYVGKVKLVRHFPGTLEIQITGAQVVSCVSSGSSWLYVSGEGKILEVQGEPKSDAMQVLGITSKTSRPGETVAIEDENAQKAYSDITGKIGELQTASSYTKLDLSDLYNIRLWYEGRVLLLLGSAANLPYKVEFGSTILRDKIGPSEKGTLDLTYADEGKRASFSAGIPEESPSSKPEASSGTDPASSQKPQEDSDEGGRGEGIPDTPFTGETDNGGGDTDDNGDAGGDGYDDGYDEGYDAYNEDGYAEDENGDWA